MHQSALENCRAFFECYAADVLPVPSEGTIVEIGSQIVEVDHHSYNSLRVVCPPEARYIGVDFVEANGVDIVLDDPYRLPFDDAYADVVLCSSVLEHSEMFWLTYLEMMRILKPAGLFFLNVPSNGNFHRYPVDCWRFYPDSGKALVTWAKRNGMNPLLLESYISLQRNDCWNDCVAVFLKDSAYSDRYPNRILDKKRDVYNAVMRECDGFWNLWDRTQDQEKISDLEQMVRNR